MHQNEYKQVYVWSSGSWDNLWCINKAIATMHMYLAQKGLRLKIGVPKLNGIHMHFYCGYLFKCLSQIIVANLNLEQLKSTFNFDTFFIEISK